MTVENLIVFPHDPSETTSVSVAGSFSSWGKLPMELNEDKNQWEFDLVEYLLKQSSDAESELNDRKFTYKFILNDNNWCCNDSKPIVKDESGIENNVITIAIKKTDELNSSSSSRFQSPVDLELETSDEALSPISSTHSPDKPSDLSPDPNVSLARKNQIAQSSNSFFGFFIWLWELILIRVFGRELHTIHTQRT